MNVDNEFRRFRFIQADDTTRFIDVTYGWLDFAEDLDPQSPKALLEGDYLAYLPDGLCFKEVSYKVEHAAVHESLPTWSRSIGRLVARVEGRDLLLDDGRRYALDIVRFERLR